MRDPMCHLMCHLIHGCLFERRLQRAPII